MYEKGRDIHLLNLFNYLNSLAIKIYFFSTFLPPGYLKNVVMLYTIVLINYFPPPQVLPTLVDLIRFDYYC